MNDDIADERLLLVSSCKPSRWKRASAFFFHFAAFPASTAILTFPPKVTFLEPLAGVVAVMASLAEASAVLLVFGTDVGGAIWRMGASGVGGIMAGDDFAFKGAFWLASFFCLCINVRLEKVKVKVEET
jgi:hypothetical protein